MCVWVCVCVLLLYNLQQDTQIDKVLRIDSISSMCSKRLRLSYWLKLSSVRPL